MSRSLTGKRSPSDQCRVVIIGGGFGGITAAKKLANSSVDVTLIDRNNYHLFQPLLYQVASGLLDPSEIAHSIRTILRMAHNVDVLMASVQDIDLEGRKVETDSGIIEYDRLIVAAGSTTDYFRQAALAERAYGLKTLEDAIRLRGRVMQSFEKASHEGDSAIRRRLLTFVVVGAGPTGIEYAGALAELVHGILPRDYPRLKFSEVRITIVESMDHVLDAFAPSLRGIARRTLERKGVEFLLNRKVDRVNEDGALVLDDGSVIDARTVIWTAGVHGEELARDLVGTPVRARRVPVDQYLHLQGHPEVWVIGDLAAVSKPGERPLPMVAPVAIQQGDYAARAIRSELRKEEVPPFSYRDKGSMATVGRNVAVVQIGAIKLGGFVGWLIWLFIHLLYIVSFRSRLVVMINWGWDYVFYDRPIRLITGMDGDWANERGRKV
jgi:NADH:ubiquinone reductase (H+-translocating)